MKPIRIPTIVLLVILSTTTAIACNIPVFRYALERWKPDALEVVIFHSGPIGPQTHQAVAELCELDAGNKSGANIDLKFADVEATLPPELASIWGTQARLSRPELPYVVVRGNHARGPFNCWASSLAHAKSAGLTHSPIRDELAKRFLTGDSVVWLVIQSQDEKNRKSLRAKLETQCEQLSRTLELSEGVGLPGSELFSDVPLFLKFSILELNRDDPKEEFLLNIARGFQPAAFNEGQGLVLPVFGRGRAMEVIPESQMTTQLIEDVTMFLCGACSCQVKSQNPGFDLLMPVSWDRELFGDEGERPPAATSISPNQRQAPTLLAIPPGSGN